VSAERYSKASEAGKKAVAVREENKRVRLNSVSIDTSIVDQTITRPITKTIKRTRTDSQPAPSGYEQPDDTEIVMISEQEFRRLYQQTTKSVLNESQDALVEKICRVIPKKAIVFIFSQVPKMEPKNISGLLNAFLEMHDLVEGDPVYGLTLQNS